MADDLQAWFRSLPERLAKDLAGTVASEAERLSAAQRGELQSLLQPPEDGGELLASCKVEDGRSDTEKVVVAGGDDTTVNGYDYARGFEFGTQRQPARSFFFAPARALMPSIRKNLETALSRAIEKA